MEDVDVRKLAIVGWVFSVASCGGTDTASEAVSMPVSGSPGGIWRGQDQASGLSVLALVDGAGNYRLIRADDVQYVGTADVSGNVFSGDLEAFAERGTTFSDGSTHGIGSISGSLVQKQTLRVNIAYRTDRGTPDDADLTLTYDQFYETKSSLPALVGDYMDVNTGTIFNVDADGHLSAQDAASGCSINGLVSIIDPNYNIYNITYTYSSCAPVAAALNGISGSGKGTFADFGVGAQVTVAVSYTVAGQSVGVVLELNRM